jgi:hypothetical protein
LFTRFAGFTRLALLACFTALRRTIAAFACFVTALALTLRAETTAAAATAWTIAIIALATFTRRTIVLSCVIALGLRITFATRFRLFGAFAFRRAVLVTFVVAAIIVVLLLRLLRWHCRLHRADEAEIVVSVLEIVLA